MPPLSITIHNHIDRTPSALETGGGGSLRSVCKQESATTAHRWSECLRRTHNGRTAVSWWLSLCRKSAFGLWPWPLTSGRENIYSNALHSHDEYLSQVSLKSVHYVRRYRVTRNMCWRTTDGRTDRRTDWQPDGRTDGRRDGQSESTKHKGGIEISGRAKCGSGVRQLEWGEMKGDGGGERKGAKGRVWFGYSGNTLGDRRHC